VVIRCAPLGVDGDRIEGASRVVGNWGKDFAKERRMWHPTQPLENCCRRLGQDWTATKTKD
jgi:hypothetical protein